MCSGGGIGGILGGIAGTLLGGPIGGFLGSELGGTVGGVVEGEDVGKAALGALPGAALSGVGGAVTSEIGGGGLGLDSGLLTGGSGGALGSVLGLGGAADTAGAGAAGAAGATAGAAPINVTPLSNMAAPAAGGVGAGGDIGAVAGSTGAATGDVSGALSGTSVAPSGGGLFDGASNWISKLFGGGASTATATDAAGNTVPVGSAATADVSGGGGGGGLMNFVSKNPALLLGGGGILASMMMNNSIPGIGPLNNEAKLLATGGNESVNALRTGQLPQGAQAGLDQANEAAKATVRSHYGNLGLSGSTMEGQALSEIDQNTASQKFGMLEKVSQLGLSEVGAANDLYKAIMSTELSQDAATQAAVSRIAAALAGGGVAASARAA